MKIYLASDHAGFEMKEEIKLFLEIEKDALLKDIEKSFGIAINQMEVIDCGAYKYEEGDDYPKFISEAAGLLSSDVYTGEKYSFAIIFGGSGEGEAMIADKYRGLRAGVINTENLELVSLLREHNNANVLSFGARFVSKDFAKEAVKIFLTTRFLDADDGKVSRHERRIEEMSSLEENILTQISSEELEGLKELENLRQQLKDN